MNLKESKEMWDKFKSIYIKISPKVMYSILQELFYYPKITKPKRYEKPVMQIFTKIKYLFKRLQLVITPSQDLWDIIAIIIAFNSLHKSFNTITFSLLEIGNKTIN